MVELDSLTERDLLIENSKDIKSLCGALTELKTDNKEGHELIFEKLAGLADQKVSNKLFFFTIGTIIAIIISMTAYIGDMSKTVTKNDVRVNTLEKRR